MSRADDRLAERRRETEADRRYDERVARVERQRAPQRDVCAHCDGTGLVGASLRSARGYTEPCRACDGTGRRKVATS